MIRDNMLSYYMVRRVTEYMMQWGSYEERPSLVSSQSRARQRRRLEDKSSDNKPVHSVHLKFKFPR